MITHHNTKHQELEAAALPAGARLSQDPSQTPDAMCRWLHHQGAAGNRSTKLHIHYYCVALLTRLSQPKVRGSQGQQDMVSQVSVVVASLSRCQQCLEGLAAVLGSPLGWLQAAGGRL